MIVRDLTGRKFGKLTVLGRDTQAQLQRGANCSCWRCLCDCGRTCTVRRPDLVSGKRTDCGCVIKPGASRPKDAEPIYRVARRMNDGQWRQVMLAPTKTEAVHLMRRMPDQQSLRVEKMDEQRVWQPITTHNASKTRYDSAEREYLAACKRSEQLHISDPWADGRMPKDANYCPVV